MNAGKLGAVKLLAAIGLISCGIGMLLYWRYGFNERLWMPWLGGYLALIAAGTLASRQPRERPPHQKSTKDRAGSGLGRRDIWLAGALLVLFVPLYLVGVHDFPRQVNTDETAIMMTERGMVSAPGQDIYGPSTYSDLPALIFWILGKCAMALGGVTLTNARLVHAASAVLIIALVFVFCRLLKLPRPGAFAAACAVGLCHSFFIFGRSAMRDNTAVLFELGALICLYIGWQQRHYGWTLLGGLAGGLTFYTYYPSRMTLVIWLMFVTAAVIGRCRDFRTAAKLAGAAVFGAAIIVSPLMIASSRHQSLDPYPTHQFLWQKEGRDQEWRFRGTRTMAEALKINAVHGLLAFNKPYADDSLLYVNPGYGFVDAVTGVLLWLGIAVIVGESIWRRRLAEHDLFALIGFLVIWLSLALLVTRAPDYTRLFIILPFIGYMIGRLAGFLGLAAGRVWRGRGQRILPWAVCAVVIIVIAGMNAQPVRAYYEAGQRGGDSVGDTIRFQEQHAREDALWLFSPGISSPYYSWGIPAYWAGWLSIGKGENQKLDIVTTGQLMANRVDKLPPGTHGYLLTTNETWQYIRPAFSSHWHVVKAEFISPARQRVAVTYTEL